MPLANIVWSTRSPGVEDSSLSKAAQKLPCRAGVINTPKQYPPSSNRRSKTTGASVPARPATDPHARLLTTKKDKSWPGRARVQKRPRQPPRSSTHHMRTRSKGLTDCPTTVERVSRRREINDRTGTRCGKGKVAHISSGDNMLIASEGSLVAFSR